MTQEEIRLSESGARKKHWKRWGPYLSERAWGTVREDYSPYGNAWEYFSHDQARSRAYRWNEDGLAGISDRRQIICFALGLWNEHDPILKERIFGLTGEEGNHGEDVKEHYFYLDSTPTHSYMKYLYKYAQAEFPYTKLVDENRRRGKNQPEFELLDTGVFDDNRYFDVFVEYAKAEVEDILIKITVANRGPETANLRLLPTAWFRNTWSWESSSRRPELHQARTAPDPVIELNHAQAGNRWLHCEGSPELLFTENETNVRRLFGVENHTPYVKDGINDYIVHGATEAVNPEHTGTKAAAHYKLTVRAGETVVVRLRLADSDFKGKNAFAGFDKTFALRRKEADEFYTTIIPQDLSADAQNVMRQGFAGMLWSKQFYHYVVKDWLEGDPGKSPPPQERQKGRNHEWTHLYNADVISMPDKWEYPWYAAWDLAFHCIPLALVDSDFAKEQLTLSRRGWYMHPNGQIPAYEWAFGDVNPPVHAWAAWRVYKTDRRIRGVADREFLERVFHKLLLNFTWWVNRKDPDGRNVFQGGFLGLDNIGPFDRSAPLPTGGYIEQSDGTSWVGMYCLNMLAMALELAQDDRAYEDVASKFFEHFVYIAHATHHVGGQDMGLWDDEDGFFYDVLNLPDGSRCSMKVRSLVGLIPLFAVETFDTEQADRLPGFKRRAQWFIDNNPELREHIAFKDKPGGGRRVMLSIVTTEQLPKVLRLMLDEEEFLSPHGVRSLFRYHKDHPYAIPVGGQEYRAGYEPAQSTTGVFGGNSNWRGPVWFPVNFLIVESLQKYHHFFGDDLKVACPTGSGRLMSLWSVAADISRRLSRLFLVGADGRRPVFGGTEKFQRDPHWRGMPLFYEYFHGDNGAGLGASHPTGRTGVGAKLLSQSGE